MTTKITTLDNGLTIASEDMPHLQSAAIGLWVDGGSRIEADNENGVAHFIEHMLFKGTKTRSSIDIAKQIEQVGGEINAYTASEHTAYFTRILSEYMPLAIEILADISQNSSLSEDNIEREKNVILQEIKTNNDNPEELLMDKCLQSAFPDQPLGRPILGDYHSIASLKRDKLIDFLNRNYTANKMVLAAAGRIDHDLLVQEVEKKFSNLKSGEKISLAQAKYHGSNTFIDRELEQVHICLSFAGVARNDPDFYATQILADVLGGNFSSRLFQTLRENKGLCYNIHAEHNAFSDCGLFNIASATTFESVTDLIETTREELYKAANEISHDEIKSATAQLRSSIIMCLESPFSRAAKMAKNIISFGEIESVDEIIDKTNKITTDDVMSVAKRLANSEPAITSIGPSL